nr:MAG TPA: hypothetical protein [Caudoviricetes sp.]
MLFYSAGIRLSRFPAAHRVSLVRLDYTKYNYVCQVVS